MMTKTSKNEKNITEGNASVFVLTATALTVVKDSTNDTKGSIQ